MRLMLSRKTRPQCSSCLALVEERVAVCLKEFRKAGGRLATYPLHKAVCACEDSVLMVLGYLLKMLPQGVSKNISDCTRPTNKLLQFPGIDLFICQWLADDLADLTSDLCEGVFPFAVERIDLALMLFWRKKNIGDHSRLIFSRDGSVSACSKWQSKSPRLELTYPVQRPLSE